MAAAVRTKLELKIIKAFRARAGIICGAILAALLVSSPSIAQPDAAPTAPRGDDPADAVSGLEGAGKPTPLSGIEVVAAKPTPLSGVEVVAKPRVTLLDGLVVSVRRTCPSPQSPPDQDAPRPRLVSTYPADGQTVRPGYLVLRLTFDRPMACRGSLPQYLLAACYFDNMQTWHESIDKRSLLILCDLKPSTRYAVSINVRIPEHFRALSGREPERGGFSFDTSGAPPITTEGGLIGRDPQLAALLSAAGPGKRARGSETAELDEASTTEVASVRVDAVKTCLQPRDPPDMDIPAPKLVSTFPANGQTVQPGLLELRLTFDLPMACTGGVLVRGGKIDPCTEHTPAGAPIAQHWRHGWDRRNLRLLCRVEPGKRYVVTLNKTVMNAPVTWPAFKSLGGGKAGPYELIFTTSDAAPIQTQEDADVEDPLMAALIEGHEADREQ